MLLKVCFLVLFFSSLSYAKMSSNSIKIMILKLEEKIKIAVLPESLENDRKMRDLDDEINKAHGYYYKYKSTDNELAVHNELRTLLGYIRKDANYLDTEQIFALKELVRRFENEEDLGINSTYNQVVEKMKKSSAEPATHSQQSDTQK